MTSCVVCGVVCVRVNSPDCVPEIIHYGIGEYHDAARANPLCVVCGDVLRSLGYDPSAYPYTDMMHQGHFPETHIAVYDVVYKLAVRKPVYWKIGQFEGVMAHLTLTREITTNADTSDTLRTSSDAAKRPRTVKKCTTCKNC